MGTGVVSGGLTPCATVLGPVLGLWLKFDSIIFTETYFCIISLLPWFCLLRLFFRVLYVFILKCPLLSFAEPGQLCVFTMLTLPLWSIFYITCMAVFVLELQPQ